jgi:hypothetical protein
MGDNSIQNAIGRRNIKIMMTVGDTTIEGMVTDVLHVLGITKNKKIVSKTSLGHVLEFSGNTIVVKKTKER